MSTCYYCLIFRRIFNWIFLQRYFLEVDLLELTRYWVLHRYSSSTYVASVYLHKNNILKVMRSGHASLVQNGPEQLVKHVTLQMLKRPTLNSVWVWLVRAWVPLLPQLKLYCRCKFSLLHLILHSKLPSLLWQLENCKRAVCVRWCRPEKESVVALNNQISSVQLCAF